MQKLDVSSKKSLREHDIEYTADGFRLANADVLIRNAGKDLLNWMAEKELINRNENLQERRYLQDSRQRHHEDSESP